MKKDYRTNNCSTILLGYIAVQFFYAWCLLYYQPEIMPTITITENIDNSRNNILYGAIGKSYDKQPISSVADSGKALKIFAATTGGSGDCVFTILL